MKSPFRPNAVPDATILGDHKPLIRSLERRGLIRGGFSLGALVMLTGCDVERPEAVEVSPPCNLSPQRWRTSAPF